MKTPGYQLCREATFLVSLKKDCFFKEVMGKTDKPPSKAKKAAKSTAKGKATTSSGKAGSTKKAGKTVKAGMEKISETG